MQAASEGLLYFDTSATRVPALRGPGIALLVMLVCGTAFFAMRRSPSPQAVLD